MNGIRGPISARPASRPRPSRGHAHSRARVTSRELLHLLPRLPSGSAGGARALRSPSNPGGGGCLLHPRISFCRSPRLRPGFAFHSYLSPPKATPTCTPEHPFAGPPFADLPFLFEHPKITFTCTPEHPFAAPHLQTSHSFLAPHSHSRAPQYIPSQVLSQLQISPSFFFLKGPSP